MAGFIRNPDTSITVRIRAENPASRIQVITPEGARRPAEAGTGFVRDRWGPGKTYTIIHWIGSGLRFRMEWNSSTDPTGTSVSIELPDTFFLSAVPLLNSDPQDQESQRVTVKNFTLANRKELASAHSVLLSARLRTSDDTPALRPSISNLQDTVHIGWASNNELQVRRPRVVSEANLSPTDTLLHYDLAVDKRGAPFLAIAPPHAGPDWVFRRLPTLGPILPSVFMCAVVAPSESEVSLDWRRAHFSVYLGNEPVVQYLQSREARFEEALINRLSSPGSVSKEVLEFVEGRKGGNVVAQLAGWLLSARHAPPSMKTQRNPSGAFGRWIGKARHLRGIPDVKALQYFWQAEESKYIELTPPVFSSTWNLLAQIPWSVWTQSKLEIEQQNWQIANFANTGGLWFSWTPGVEAPDIGHLNLSDVVAKSPVNAIRLIQRVQQAAQESQLSSENFSHLLQWNRRTLLERRILDQVLARGAVVPENEDASCALLEEFARTLGIPLPIVAISVDKLAGQERNNETTPPAPGRSPVGVGLNEYASQVQHELTAGAMNLPTYAGAPSNFISLGSTLATDDDTVATRHSGFASYCQTPHR
jgi:hypothetical protein